MHIYGITMLKLSRGVCVGRPVFQSVARSCMKQDPWRAAYDGQNKAPTREGLRPKLKVALASLRRVREDAALKGTALHLIPRTLASRDAGATR